jgi:hypothetical protein
MGILPGRQADNFTEYQDGEANPDPKAALMRRLEQVGEDRSLVDLQVRPTSVERSHDEVQSIPWWDVSRVMVIDFSRHYVLDTIHKATPGHPRGSIWGI